MMRSWIIAAVFCVCYGLALGGLAAATVYLIARTVL